MNGNGIIFNDPYPSCLSGFLSFSREEMVFLNSFLLQEATRIPQKKYKREKPQKTEGLFSEKDQNRQMPTLQESSKCSLK